jgi:(p)ppGpp synthase/HD superfamily hydrolase
LSYLKLEREFDHAVVFMATRASEAKSLPVASILHSVRVGLYLQGQGASKEVVLAGLLHDVVEDTDATIEEVAAQFGEGVARLVQAMTVDENLDSAEGSRDSVDRCRHLGRDALFIKAADIADNLHFYLPDANPQRLDQLAESLSYFLDVSAKVLEETDVWREIRRQRETVLEMIGRMN